VYEEGKKREEGEIVAPALAGQSTNWEGAWISSGSNGEIPSGIPLAEDGHSIVSRTQQRRQVGQTEQADTGSDEDEGGV